MIEKVYFYNTKGNKLCGILSNPTDDKSKPIIVMIHGFLSNKSTKKFIELEKIFSERGISSFRFDVFGHGESEGNFEEMTITEAVDDILQAVEYLKKQGYRRIGLIGSSFGGMASIMAASKISDLFILGLICPVSDYEEIEYTRRGEKEIKEWKERGFTYAVNEKTGERLKLNYSFYEDFKNNEAYIAARKIAIPTIIVHGDKDTVVPLEQSRKLAKLISNSKLVIVNGADHYFRDEKYFDELMKRISSSIKISKSPSSTEAVFPVSTLVRKSLTM